MKRNVNTSLEALVKDEKDIMHVGGLMFIDIHYIKIFVPFVVT